MAYREPLLMGIVTAIAVFAVLAITSRADLAAFFSAIVAGVLAFGVTWFQVKRRR